MAYVAPFRRAGIRHKQNSPSPPFPGERKRYSATNLSKTANIKHASDCVRKVLIEQWKRIGDDADEDNDHRRILVDFVPARVSESSSFLDGQLLYVLAPAGDADNRSNFSRASSALNLDDLSNALDDYLSISGSVAPEEDQQVLEKAVLKTAMERISPAVSKALTNIKNMENNLGPNEGLTVKLLFRFGKLLTFSPRRRRLEPLNPVKASDLEKQLVGVRTLSEPVFRSLETSLSEHLFQHMEEIAESDANVKTKVIDKYSIQVLDEKQPDILFKVTCCSIEGESKQGGGGHSPQLKLMKVKLDHERHLVLDICPLGYETDFRLILTTRTTFLDLEEDVKKGIQEIVDKAIIDKSVPGGLGWPEGAVKFDKSKGEGRFTLRGVRHAENGRNHLNSVRKWRLREVDGIQFYDSYSRRTREVEMVPMKWKQLLKRNVSSPSRLSNDKPEIPELRTKLSQSTNLFDASGKDSLNVDKNTLNASEEGAIHMQKDSDETNMVEIGAKSLEGDTSNVDSKTGAKSSDVDTPNVENDSSQDFSRVAWEVEDIVSELPSLLEWIAEHLP